MDSPAMCLMTKGITALSQSLKTTPVLRSTEYLLTKEALPTRLEAVYITLIEMVTNFTKEEINNIFTNDETTQALLNKGYRHKLSYGFHVIELTRIIFDKYKGDLIISYKKDYTGCVAYLDDEEIFDSSMFDSASHLGNALGHLLLILDNKLKKEDDGDKTAPHTSS